MDGSRGGVIMISIFKISSLRCSLDGQHEIFWKSVGYESRVEKGDTVDIHIGLISLQMNTKSLKT